MSATGFVTSAAYLAHDPGPGHPERAARLTAVRKRLEATGLLAELDATEPKAASVADLGRVHPDPYIVHVSEEIRSGAPFVDAPDANSCPETLDAALLAAGGALLAVDRVMDGAWKNAFVAARPPGHHAEEDRAMGFCFFNNVAIAARHLQQKHGIEKVAIVDWDVHHGNGTQHIFERDPSVFYASLHQYPHYPGTGAERERGIAEGEGTTRNCPMAAGTGNPEWLRAFEAEVLPALEDFDPGFVLISAGFDAHERDPLSATRLSEDAYERMTADLCALARERCGGRIVSLLEGGYDLEGLALSAETHVRELMAAAHR